MITMDKRRKEALKKGRASAGKCMSSRQIRTFCFKGLHSYPIPSKAIMLWSMLCIFKISKQVLNLVFDSYSNDKHCLHSCGIWQPLLPQEVLATERTICIILQLHRNYYCAVTATISQLFGQSIQYLLYQWRQQSICLANWHFTSTGYLVD